MDISYLTGLQNEVIAELKTDLKGDPRLDEDILEGKVKNAIRDVFLRRHYEHTSYDPDKITKDMYQYFSVIKNVALYDYNQIGGEFQTSHNENSINRTWVSRDTLFNNVHAFVRVL